MRSESVVVPAHRTERIDTRDQRRGQAHGHTDTARQRHGGIKRGTERVKRGTGKRNIRRGVFDACAGGEAVSWVRRIMSPFAVAACQPDDGGERSSSDGGWSSSNGLQHGQM